NGVGGAAHSNYVAEAASLPAEAPADFSTDPAAADVPPDQSAGAVRTSRLTPEQLKSDNCPACGTAEMRVLFSATDRLFGTTNKQFQIVECRSCRLIRLYPRPAPTDLREYYPPEYWYTAEEATVDRLEQRYRRFVLRDHLSFVERA